MRRWILGALCPLLFAAAAHAQTAPRPSLVVLITVDQLIPEYFTRWPGQLTGGLHRLYSGGAVFTEAYHDHGVTETAPGHATLLSGRFPRGTGIVRNLAGVQDSQAPLVGGGSSEPASPFRFRGSTLIDWLRAQDPRSRALSVSKKDRGAILPLGRAHQSVFWYGMDGRFTTSRYYADTLPSWVRGFNARGTVRSLAGRSWDLLLPDTAYPEPDSVPAESRGRNYTFPHRLPRDSAALVDSVGFGPWLDQMTLDLALEGVGAMGLGAGPATDLLAVSLSSTDAVGHRFGPDSREVHDQILRLDRMLGVFLDSLLAMRGAGRVAIALSADHGVTSFPELTHPGDFATYFLSRRPYQAWLAEAARRAGMDSAAFEYDDGMVFYDRRAAAEKRVDLERVMADFVAFARTQPGVLRADLPAALAADSARDPLARRWMHMFSPDLPIGAVVTPREGYLWGSPGGSAQHGSVHDADARVPLIFFGPWFRAGRHEDFVRTVDLAPTLAHVAGVLPTEPLDGRILTAALSVGP